MAVEESRFDWGSIFKSVAIVVGGTAALALLAPVGGALADGDGPLSTRTISGHEIYRWMFWIVGWALTFLQGAWMLRNVGDHIIDDMLAISIISAIGLLVVKFVVWLLYDPTTSTGQSLFFFEAIDAGGALLLIVVGLIAARFNRY
jgi:hypothetical protein